jgi:hypothetical protein
MRAHSVIHMQAIVAAVKAVTACIKRALTEHALPAFDAAVPLLVPAFGKKICNQQISTKLN